MINAGIMTNLEFDEITEKHDNCVVVFSSLSDANSRIVLPVIDYVSEKHKNCPFIALDISSAQNIAEKFNITSIPTLIFLKKGKEKERIKPTPNVIEIEQFISLNTQNS